LLAAAAGVLGCAAKTAPPHGEPTEERRLAGDEGWLQGRALGLGSAIPVALIHGVGGDHHLFESQLADLRRGRRVLAFDQRGCGGSSDAPRSGYDLETRVRDLSLVLDALRYDPVVVVGHGTGGQVVARYAELNPVRVLGLVLISPVSGNAEAGRIANLPDAELRTAVDNWLGTLLVQASAATQEQVLASANIARVPAMRAMLRDAAGTDLIGSLATYPGPVLVLAAPNEPVPGPLRDGVVVRRLSGGSRWSPIDQAAEVNEALMQFLQPLDAEELRRRRGR
jgi:pimeloyl-ACP methyl ester carboxylesterase